MQLCLSIYYVILIQNIFINIKRTRIIHCKSVHNDENLCVFQLVKKKHDPGTIGAEFLNFTGCPNIEKKKLKFSN